MRAQQEGACERARREREAYGRLSSYPAPPRSPRCLLCESVSIIRMSVFVSECPTLAFAMFFSPCVRLSVSPSLSLFYISVCVLVSFSLLHVCLCLCLCLSLTCLSVSQSLSLSRSLSYLVDKHTEPILEVMPFSHVHHFLHASVYTHTQTQTHIEAMNKTMTVMIIAK